MRVTAGERVDTETDPAGFKVFHPKIHVGALQGDFESHRREAAILQPERLVAHGSITNDDHFHWRVDAEGDVLRRQRVQLLLRQQRLGLGGIHRHQFLQRDGLAEPVDDAGHRVVNGWVFPHVRLAKRGGKQKRGQDRVPT